MYRDIPTIDEMATNLPQHMNFYVRGVFNSILPQFLNPFSSVVRAEDISGEMIEALRFVSKSLAPDLKEGQMIAVTYDDVQKLFKEKSVLEDYQIESIGDQIRTSLGAFAIAMRDGQYTIIDTYDYEDYVGQNIRAEGGSPVLTDYISAAREAGQTEGMYGAARVMGGYFMPENEDRSSADDALRVNIKIPREPQLIATDYDNDPISEQFVFRGNMTSKRAGLFSSFMNIVFPQAEAATLENADVPTPKPRPERTVEAPKPRPTVADMQSREGQFAFGDEMA